MKDDPNDEQNEKKDEDKKKREKVKRGAKGEHDQIIKGGGDPKSDNIRDL